MSELFARFLLGAIVSALVFYAGFKRGQHDREQYWLKEKRRWMDRS